MIHSIFISRNSTELPLLTEFCDQHDIALIAHSLISFELVHNQCSQEYDVLFFSSIRAAEFYLKQHHVSANTKIATIGETTAEKLRNLGLNVDFVGSTAGNPKIVADEFSSWLHGRKVLIPCSDRSNRSIANSLPDTQVEELVVYRTIANPKQITPCDVYIFSSPSNFESFMKLNVVPLNSVTMAWGITTDKAMRERGIVPEHILTNSTEEEILNYLRAKK